MFILSHIFFKVTFPLSAKHIETVGTLVSSAVGICKSFIHASFSDSTWSMCNQPGLGLSGRSPSSGRKHTTPALVAVVIHVVIVTVKPGFHYPSSRAEFKGRVDGPWTWVHFLSRVSILLLMRDIDIVILSVCPLVCLSVHDTLVLYENGLTYRHSFSTIR